MRSRVLDKIAQWELYREEGRAESPESLCRDCPELLADVRQGIQRLQGFPATLRETHDTLDAAATPPTRVAPEVAGYELLGELGRGGMGVVYKARQLMPNRLVALKVVLAGDHAGPAALTRFLGEAEAIARLRHPNAVQIYEVGQSNGQPFFSLEFCDGGNLGEKLAGQPLSPRDAATLIRTLAGAAQAAHAAGIVHRDIKPANILMLKDGTPKLADFGLAKQMAGPGDQAAEGITSTGAVMGTPYYMAPEQAAGHTHAVGPAVDVYALGAVLYECLTGRPPFKAAGVAETLRQVLHDDAVPPRRLNGQIPRDLETVCVKCLHKDPKRRYATAETLADDLGRFLDGRPVAARRVGRLERAGRWAQRNPGAAGIAGLLVVVVAAALAAVGISWRNAIHQQGLAEAAAERAREAQGRAEREAENARRAQTRAETEAEKAGAVSQFLARLFEESDPFHIMDSATVLPRPAAGDKLTARDLLDRGVERLANDKSISPETRALIEDRIGGAYLVLGENRRADPHLKAALDYRRNQPDTAALAASLHTYAWNQQCIGNFVVAERCFREALQLREHNPAVGEAERARTLFHLAWLLAEREEPAAAERLFRETVDRRVALFGEVHRDVALARFGLAAVLFQQGKELEGLAQSQKARAILAASPGDAELAQIISLFQEAVALSAGGAHGPAEQKLLAAIEVLKRVVGPTHGYLGLFYGQLAAVRLAAVRLGPADEAIKQSFAIIESWGAFYHPLIRRAAFVHWKVMEALGRTAESDELFAKLIRAQQEHFGKTHVFVADTMTTYAVLGKNAHGESWEAAQLRDALAIYRASREPQRETYATCLACLGRNLAGREPAQAEPLLREALPLMQKKHGDDNTETAGVKVLLAKVRLAQGVADGEVERLLTAARKAVTPSLLDLSARDGDLPLVLLQMGVMYRLRKQPAEALSALRDSRGKTRDDPWHLVEVAREFLRCADLEGGPGADAVEKEALTTLRLAGRQGWTQRQLLQTEPIFAPLRRRPEFPELLRAGK
ncbi:MAG: protein kinase domain-containing protein [Gemmataceae bacterium]